MRMLSLFVALVIGQATFADSLFSQEVAEQGTFVSLKKKKYLPGDIITVLVREKIEASTNANTNTKKEAGVESEADESENAFLVTPESDGSDPDHPDGLGLITAGKLPNWSLGAKNEHRTTGATQRKNSLVTTITCRVVQVTQNGLIHLEGEKNVSVNREDSRIYVKGVARARDVSPTNTIDSAQLADAIIELKGRGPLWNNQRRGLVTRLLDWVSPY
ncbi:MAG: flagellar basal body L-ring protein FlgH [Candidatus Hydrogenedentes bacterium]|nr:flagellar basal body L-ring protein FlgH [Candidatus Hydrogenedentota bacterium]